MAGPSKILLLNKDTTKYQTEKQTPHFQQVGSSWQQIGYSVAT